VAEMTRPRSLFSPQRPQSHQHHQRGTRPSWSEVVAGNWQLAALLVALLFAAYKTYPLVRLPCPVPAP
jgi:hypothetical protein